MKFSFAWAALVAGMLQLLATAPVLAQAGGAGRVNPPLAPRGTNVAVIDISLVFEHYPDFQAQMKALKGEVEQFEASLRAEGEKMKGQAEQLREFAPTSDEYKRREEALATAQSGLNVKMGLQRKEFLEKEARIYFAAYNRVYDEIAKLADRNDIKLVLRFNSEEMKPDDRNSVLQGVNRAVVFQRNLNVTKLVVEALGGTLETKTEVTNRTIPQPRAPGLK